MNILVRQRIRYEKSNCTERFFLRENRIIMLKKCLQLTTNKPRTAKVGAISKAQNCKRGDPAGFAKLQLVAKNEKKI